MFKVKTATWKDATSVAAKNMAEKLKLLKISPEAVAGGVVIGGGSTVVLDAMNEDKLSTMLKKAAKTTNDDNSYKNPFPIPKKWKDTAKSLIPGAVAGGISTAIMYPIDTIQIAKQTGVKIPKTPGRLYKGIGMKMLKIIPTTAISFAAFDYMKKLMTGNKK